VLTRYQLGSITGQRIDAQEKSGLMLGTVDQPMQCCALHTVYVEDANTLAHAPCTIDAAAYVTQWSSTGNRSVSCMPHAVCGMLSSVWPLWCREARDLVEGRARRAGPAALAGQHGQL
jgi:hypothetical protein